MNLQQVPQLLIAALTPLVAYVAITVQALSVDVAVLKNRTNDHVNPALYSSFVERTNGEMARQKEWLARLSARVNALETVKETK